MSEYNEGSGGSKWGLVLKVTGIGCAVLLLIGGVLTGLGVFKAVSCCTEVAELAEVGHLAGERGYEFARALHDGEGAAAGGLVASSRQEALEEAFTTYGADFQKSLPFPVEYGVDQSLERDGLREFSRWYVHTLFAGAQDEEALALRIEVEVRRTGEELDFTVSNWRFSREPRELNDNPWSRAVRRFGEQLRRDQISQALFMVHYDGPLGGLSEEEFRARAAPLVEITTETRPRVHSILPVGPEAVEVIERYETLDGSEVREVGYLLTRNQQIHEFKIGGVLERRELQEAPSSQGGEEAEDEEMEAPEGEVNIIEIGQD